MSIILPLVLAPVYSLAMTFLALILNLVLIPIIILAITVDLIGANNMYRGKIVALPTRKCCRCQSR